MRPSPDDRNPRRALARAATPASASRWPWIVAASAALLAAALMLAPRAGAAEEPFIIPAPAVNPASTETSEVAVRAGGCFWGVQAISQFTKGVEMAISGYSGGAADTATYRQVGTGQTGHAEAVEIRFNPQEISYGEILQIYFSVAHDPTQLNYQGPDWGPQYRSAIFYTNENQKAVAEAYIAQLDATGIYKDPIVTMVQPLDAFYAAEDYHQDYLLNNPSQPYIVYNDLPKLENLARVFPDHLRVDPVRVASAR